jgi:hypothetical protein
MPLAKESDRFPVLDRSLSTGLSAASRAFGMNDIQAQAYRRIRSRRGAGATASTAAITNQNGAIPRPDKMSQIAARVSGRGQYGANVRREIR